MPQPVRIVLLLLAALGVLGIVGYLFVRALRRSEDPARFLFHWAITLVLVGSLVGAAVWMKDSYAAVTLPFLCIALAVVLTVLWGRSLVEAVFRPLLSIFDGGQEEVEPAPMYSIAEARRKQGKYHEAVFELHNQLAKFPNDLKAQMMLAEIQAENMNDLPGAEVTIQRLCAQPRHPPQSIAFALSTLADWHLRFDQDIEAARAALEKIIEKFPGSELARNAANRIAHLGGSQLLAEAHERPVIALKPGVEYLGLLKDQSELLPKEQDARAEAADLAKHLDEYPSDTEARERLAVIYARHYGRLDFATEQLEQLISQPNESPRHIARWMNLLADLQVHCTNDTVLAEQTLRRIIERFPNQSFAELAQQRLMSLNLELKRFEKTRVVKMAEDAGTAKT